MSNIDKQALRERYSPKPVPECHICGKEMTIQRMSASRITYGCTGATYDDKGCHYAEGRSIADDHYEQSCVTVVDVSDPDVLAMLDELEAAKQDSARWFKAFEKAVSIGARYEERIAELEARTVTLPPKEHDNGTDSQIDINAGFANRMWQKCYDAIRAAGIGVKGE
ncbi:ead/Ea22-like family protein [Salmonella enterica subsp. enterica serovar Tennessee]|nr:ead/Ea22-like family protein [Salmonella enterica subsp. enterica serovar Tennessee]